MKTKSSKLSKSKLQRFLKRPLCLPFDKPGNWRAKHILIKLAPNNHYQITLRTFKTNPSTRSKKKTQYVFSVRLGLYAVKEIAVWRKKSNKKPKNNIVSQPKINLKYSYGLLAIGLFGITFFGWQIFTDLSTKPPAVVAQASIQAEPLPVEEKVGLEKSEPTNLAIDSVDISAEINSVGQNQDGTIETPEIFDKWVGWYKYSPTPGEIGPSVLLGHVDTYKGPSVFWNLSRVKLGDIVKVNRQDGSVAKFKVTAVEQYSQDEFPTQKVYGDTEGPELRLITCGGDFNYFTLRYSKNTVVYAKYID